MSVTLPATRGTLDWFPGVDTGRTARVRLVCFSYAGGTPSIYRHWAQPLGADVQLVPVLLPGRGTRLRERPHTGMGPLVAEIVDALVGAGLAADCAMFGHSMGALLAYEVACELRRRGHQQPLHLFVSGSRPPHLYGRENNHALDDDALQAMVRGLGGLAAEGTLTEGYLVRRLPVLRSDLAVCESYRWTPRTPLECPTTAFSGTQDPIATPAQTDGWRDYTSRSFVARVVPGNHFFLTGVARDRVLAGIRAELDLLLADRSRVPVPATSTQGMIA